jgi:acyl-CoA thioesterase FadM
MKEAQAMTFASDDLNPKFVFFSPVKTAVTGTDALIEHVDHAIIALDARAPLGGTHTIEQLGSAVDGNTLRVDLWVNDLDDYTCTYGFVVSSENGRVPYARGERSMVNVNATPWSPDFRAAHVELMKDLPAFA